MNKFIRSSGIYSITSPSGNFYIGSAVCFRHRWKIHKTKLENNKHHNKPLQNAFHKYGMESLKFEILLICRKEDLFMYEQKAIDTLNPSYNLCRSVRGTGGLSPSQETRDKIRKALKGRKMPREVAEKISMANKGKKRPKESVEKTRTAHLGMKRSEESRKKMSYAQKGRKFSPERIEMMKVIHKGRKPAPQTIEATILSNRTRIVSPETREKMAASQRARWAHRFESSHE